MMAGMLRIPNEVMDGPPGPRTMTGLRSGQERIGHLREVPGVRMIPGVNISGTLPRIRVAERPGQIVRDPRGARWEPRVGMPLASVR